MDVCEMEAKHHQYLWKPIWIFMKLEQPANSTRVKIHQLEMNIYMYKT